MHHLEDTRQVLALRSNTPKSKHSSPINRQKLKRSAEPATPLQNPRYSRKRAQHAEPSWAQVFGILAPDSASDSEVYRRQIQDLEEVIDFANLERKFRA